MISIILVHYHVKKELLSCIASIYASKPKSSIEIIVVDNDEKKTIEKDLKKQFPKVRYVKNDNKGFGQGNNVGSQYAKGEYLFFLNPDTLVSKNTIDALVSYLDKHKKVGIAAPILHDVQGEVVALQGARELTPLRAIFSFSFLNKLFPGNPIKKQYWYLDEWNKKSVKEVESIPGTAFVIRRELYKTVQGFDEKFFLYFEEQDLCKRITKLGWKIVMHPQANVSHSLGASTKQSKRDTNKIFQQSRFYYLKKHFGFWKAFGAEIVLRFNKYALLLLLALIAGAYLRFFNLELSMAFIGDQGWYYLSARDMMVAGDIPLVGIPSSHPWISQGAYWTYLLGPVLWLFQFNPLSGAYLSGTIGLISIIGLYKLGSVMFSRNVGIIAALLFATSPLVVFSDRMPYHTSPIPLVTIFTLFAMYKWIQGNTSYFPVLILLLAMLYNFELATFLLTLFVIGVLFYGYLVNKSYIKKLFDRNIIFLTVGGWFMAMLPMIIHDVSHGFPQTLKFLAWVGYRVLVFFGYPPINPITPVPFDHMGLFVIDSVQRLVFMPNTIIAGAIFLGGIFVLLHYLFRKKHTEAAGLLLFVNVFLVVGLFLVKTPSEAYLPMLFPGIVLMSAVLFNRLRMFGMAWVILVIVINSYAVVSLTTGNVSFAQRLAAATTIVQEAEGKEYTIEGKGPGSQFESFTMNYEYLTWWLGHEPSKKVQELRFVISEENGITVTKEMRPES